MFLVISHSSLFICVFASKVASVGRKVSVIPCEQSSFGNQGFPREWHFTSLTGSVPPVGATLLFHGEHRLTEGCRPHSLSSLYVLQQWTGARSSQARSSSRDAGGTQNQQISGCGCGWGGSDCDPGGHVFPGCFVGTLASETNGVMGRTTANRAFFSFKNVWKFLLM